MKYSSCFVLFLFLAVTTTAQLQLTVSTNKDSYAYGENIVIYCTITNTADTTVTHMAYNTESCQAEFYFNEFSSAEHESCLPASELLEWQPGESRIYEWVIEPERYGLPNKEGMQRIIGYFLEELNVGEDTTYISAPQFIGGQLIVSFEESKQSQIDSVKDSLNVEVLEHSEFDGTIGELWQLREHNLEEVYEKYKNDNRFRYVDYNRRTAYNKVITSVEDDEIKKTFYLSEAFPNPFNPSTGFYLEVKETQNVEIAVYNYLGQLVRKIFNGRLEQGQKHKFSFTAEGLSSGVYIIKANGKTFSELRKTVLIK